MAGILGDIEERITSPLFLAGAGLLSGQGFGGLAQGLQMGSQLNAQRQKQAEMQRRQQAFKDYIGQGGQGMDPKMLGLANALGPDQGLDVLAKSHLQQQGWGHDEKMARLNNDLAAQRAAADPHGLQRAHADLYRAQAARQAQESTIPKMSPAETAVDKAFAKTYEEDFASGGVADQQKNLNQIKEVQDLLKSGNGLTGPVVGSTPDFINKFINPKAVDTRERVEEVVQRNLRVILGAQFTNEEGKRLVARAYNPSLDEATNAQRLGNLFNSMNEALNAKRAAAAYYEKNGTLRGYKGSRAFSIADFEKSIDGPQATQGQPQPSADGWTEFNGVKIRERR